MTVDIIDYYLKTNLEIQFYVDEIEYVEKLGRSPPPLIAENQKRKRTINTFESTLNPKANKTKRRSWANCAIM